MELLDPALWKLLPQYGVLGIVCVLFFVLFRQAIKDLKECNAFRIEDVKALGDIAKQNTEAIVRWTEVLVDHNKSREALAAALLAQSASLENLRLVVANQRDVDARFERLSNLLHDRQHGRE